MPRVDIKIGFGCNNRCLFCVQGEKRKSLPAKSKEEIKKALKESFNLGKREVVFTGGEPTVHPNFLELVKFARDTGFSRIQIQSNGRMFAYMNFCAKAIKAGANEFSPAPHGSNAEIHDFLTRSKGSFNQTVQGIKNLKKLNQYILTNTVVTSKNYKDLPNLAKLLVKLNVNQFQFAFVHILGTAAKNKDWLVPKKSEVMPYIKKGLEIGIKAGKKVTTEAIPYCLLKGYEKRTAEEIIPEARVYDNKFVVENYNEYRKNSGKAKAPKCKKCKYFEICEGPWKEYPEIFGWKEFKPVT